MISKHFSWLAKLHSEAFGMDFESWRKGGSFVLQKYLAATRKVEKPGLFCDSFDYKETCTYGVGG